MTAQLTALTKDCKIIVMNDAVAAGTTTITPTTPVDMTGFESVTFIVLTGDVTNTGVITITSNEVATNTNSGGTAITAGAATFTADATSGDVKALATEHIRPKLRYVYPTVARTVANSVLNGIIAILSGPTNPPVTQHSTLIAKGLSLGN